MEKARKFPLNKRNSRTDQRKIKHSQEQILTSFICKEKKTFCIIEHENKTGCYFLDYAPTKILTLGL